MVSTCVAVNGAQPGYNGLFSVIVLASAQRHASEVAIFTRVALSWRAACRYDGTAYASQCPIPKGQSFTYSFIVDEQVGTYLWHDHSQMYRADGLQVCGESQESYLGYHILVQPILACPPYGRILVSPCKG